jgi:type II secretory pathway pseudopilin PulG
VTTPGGRDTGESLVELLVTIVVLGIVTAGIAGALLATGKASSMHRQQVLAQNQLRAWAEQISAANYVPCASVGSFAGPSPALPGDFTATVTAVQYWNGTSSFAGTCGTDTGIQRVTLQITAQTGLTAPLVRRLAIVVRKPCASSC